MADEKGKLEETKDTLLIDEKTAGGHDLGSPALS